MPLLLFITLAATFALPVASAGLKDARVVDPPNAVETVGAFAEAFLEVEEEEEITGVEHEARAMGLTTAASSYSMAPPRPMAPVWQPPPWR